MDAPFLRKDKPTALHTIRIRCNINFISMTTQNKKSTYNFIFQMTVQSQIKEYITAHPEPKCSDMQA